MKKIINMLIVGIFYICTICAISIPSGYQPNLEWELNIGGSDFETCYL